MSPVDPALSSATTSRLAGVVAVNMLLDVPWQAISTARQAAKQAKLPYSPSLMLAWCITQAMIKHPAFCRLVQPDGKIVEHPVFDLGVAVVLTADQTATGIIRGANQLDWRGFASAYGQAVTQARTGQSTDVQAPLILTSLGASGIEVATPIVVPPSMANLCVGQAHVRMFSDSGIISPIEVVTISLTFDHRVVNGAGAAAFLQEVKLQAVGFKLPS